MRGKVMSHDNGCAAGHIDTLTKTVERQGGALKTAHLTIDKLNLELAYLRRMRYGRSSEQILNRPRFSGSPLG